MKYLLLILIASLAGCREKLAPANTTEEGAQIETNVIIKLLKEEPQVIIEFYPVPVDELLVVDANQDKVLVLNGIADTNRMEESWYPYWQRPSCPDDVEINIWTTDGTEWKAEWKKVDEY